MFESIVSEIARVIRRTVRTIGAATHGAASLAPVVILAFFLAIKS